MSNVTLDVVKVLFEFSVEKDYPVSVYPHYSKALLESFKEKEQEALSDKSHSASLIAILKQKDERISELELAVGVNQNGNKVALDREYFISQDYGHPNGDYAAETRGYTEKGKTYITEVNVFEPKGVTFDEMAAFMASLDPMLSDDEQWALLTREFAVTRRAKSKDLCQQANCFLSATHDGFCAAHCACEA